MFYFSDRQVNASEIQIYFKIRNIFKLFFLISFIVIIFFILKDHNAKETALIPENILNYR